MRREPPQRSTELSASVTLINVYASGNNHILALSLPPADTETILLSQVHTERAVIMMGIIVLAGVDLNLLRDSGSHPFQCWVKGTGRLSECSEGLGIEPKNSHAKHMLSLKQHPKLLSGMTQGAASRNG